MDIDKSLAWLKLSFKQAFIVCVITSILLFANDEIIQKLGLLSFREFAKTWIGVIWLVSVGLLVSDIAIKIYEFAKNKYDEKKELESLFQRLENLSENENFFCLTILKTILKLGRRKYRTVQPMGYHI